MLGPSDDGGYYLIGLNRMNRRLFEDIAWSTSSVFEQTLERAKESGVTIDLLPTWYDVDDQTTLRRLCEELLGDTMVSAGYAAPETHAFIANLIAREGRERIWPNN